MDPSAYETIVDDGGAGQKITGSQLEAHLERVAVEWVLNKGVRRLLLLPPDHTRLHSKSGQITQWLWQRLSNKVDVWVMPTVGTHQSMTPQQCATMFADVVPLDRILPHRWREDAVELGEISPARMSELSGGRLALPAKVEINRQIVGGDFDLVLSIGQVVPHEVIGLANYTKNVCIGAGGRDLIHKSHYLGALCDMETVMGRKNTAVRELVNQAFHEFVRPRANVCFLLTVVADDELRGFFAGPGPKCFDAAAVLAAKVNVTFVDRALDRCVVYLDPHQYRTTWLGNKAIYRSRMAMADGGELLIVAPGVHGFGEDPAIDALIREFGYHGTAVTIAAVAREARLADNLAAAAHLIHGSTEGRFRVTYCPGQSLTCNEVEQVGYGYESISEVEQRFCLSNARPGWNDDKSGNPFYYIDQPGQGLWTTKDRFGADA